MPKTMIQKEIEFDAGHRVSTHRGKCSSPHGHRYKVVIQCIGYTIEDPDDPDFGMVRDFGFLKDILTGVHDKFDHGFIFWDEDIDMSSVYFATVDKGWKYITFPYQPTAENLARYIYDMLEQTIETYNMTLAKVQVWETRTSMAAYPWGL